MPDLRYLAALSCLNEAISFIERERERANKAAAETIRTLKKCRADLKEPDGSKGRKSG